MPRLSKSEAIRQLLDSEPGLGPSEIRDRLVDQGIRVDTHLVKVVRANHRKALTTRRKIEDQLFRVEWERYHARAEWAYQSQFVEWAKTCGPFPPVPLEWDSSVEAGAEFEAEFDEWFWSECQFWKPTAPPRNEEFRGVFDEPPDYPERPDQAEYYAAIIMIAVLGLIPEGELRTHLLEDLCSLLSFWEVQRTKADTTFSSRDD